MSETTKDNKALGRNMAEIGKPAEQEKSFAAKWLDGDRDTRSYRKGHIGERPSERKARLEQKRLWQNMRNAASRQAIEKKKLEREDKRRREEKKCSNYRRKPTRICALLEKKAK